MRVEPSPSGVKLIAESELERWALEQWRRNPPSWKGKPDYEAATIRFDEEPWAPRVGDTIRQKMTGATAEVVSVQPPGVEAIIRGLDCTVVFGRDIVHAYVNPHDYELVARKSDRP
jgi:hypothetical protein